MTDAPIWGFGPGAGPRIYARYSALDPRIKYRRGRETAWHSLYEQIAVETGVIGVAVLVTLLALMVKSSYRRWRESAELTPLLGALGFIMVAATVSGMDAASGLFVGFALLARAVYRPPPERMETMFDRRWAVTPLTQELLRQQLPRLVEIDSDTIGERWSPSHWFLDLPGKWELSRIASIRGVVMGFLIASRKGDRVHLHRAAVVRERRSMGLGRQLVRELANEALLEGCTGLSLKVHKTNIASQSWLTGLGFKVTGEDGENLSMAAPPGAISGVQVPRSPA
jgi:ribosomal protein S18 acetylase RimI-like enzyme